MKLILASASPRRKELLAKTGLVFDIIPAKGEENITKTIPAEVVMELSLQKAKEIADQQAEGRRPRVTILPKIAADNIQPFYVHHFE